jgi:hypothetical protein
MFETPRQKFVVAFPSAQAALMYRPWPSMTVWVGLWPRPTTSV